MIFMAGWYDEDIWNVIAPGAEIVAITERNYLLLWVESFTPMQIIAFLPSIGVLPGLIVFQCQQPKQK